MPRALFFAAFFFAVAFFPGAQEDSNVAGARAAARDALFESVSKDCAERSAAAFESDFFGRSGSALVFFEIAAWRFGSPLRLIEIALPSRAGEIDAALSALKKNQSDEGGTQEPDAEFDSEETAEDGDAAQDEALSEIELAKQAVDNAAAEESQSPPIEKNWRDSSGALSIAQRDGETLSVSRRDGGAMLVSSDDSAARRRFYDSRARLSRVELWKKDESGAKKARTIDYVYEGENVLPSSSKITAGPAETETRYDESGNAVETSEFTVDDDGNRTLSEKTERRFDERGRVVESRTQVWRDERTFTSREIFTFTSDDRSPDSERYENDILRARVVRPTDTSRIETIYFSDDLSIVAEYENDKKISETLLRGKSVVRSKSYAP